MIKMVYINLFIPIWFLLWLLVWLSIFNASSWEIEMDSKISLHFFFWDIEKAYLNKNLNKNFSKICKGYQVILASAYPGRIRNIAVFLSDFIKFSRNISISLDVALVNGDFLFSGGLFNPSFATLDDELMCFSMLFLNWGDLKSILNNINQNLRETPNKPAYQ